MNNILHKSADQSESVIIAAALAWSPVQALLWNPRSATTSKGMLVLDSMTLLIFRVPDSTKSSTRACLCTVMMVLHPQ